MLVVLWCLALVWIVSDGFSTVRNYPRHFRPSFRMATTSNNNNQQEEEQSKTISELDARVLQSILKENSKLDLNQEANMKKLLERAVAPKSPSPSNLPTDGDNAYDESEDGPYSSKLFQTLADTKLWKSLQAKADDLLESAKIYVTNRIERDAKLLASVGLFAWDRAVRDVARAFPAAKVATLLQLGNTSSYTSTTMDELNTPMDELQSVTQSIRDIFNGVSSSGSARSLRTVAPAGQANTAERQRRAYTAATARQQQPPPSLGTLTDVAWEMKRELEVETPGYRTKTFRTAIEAGTQTTVRVIGAVQDGKTLRQALLEGMSQPPATTGRTVMALEEGVIVEDATERVQDTPMKTMVVEESILPPLPASLLDEAYNVVLRMRQCIEQPEDTWLTFDVLESIPVNTASLQETVTAMICARDEWIEKNDVYQGDDYNASIEELVSHLTQVKRRIDDIIELATASAGAVASSRLQSILYGEEAVFLSLGEIQSQYKARVEEISKKRTASESKAVVVEEQMKAKIWFADTIEEESVNSADMMDMTDVYSTISTDSVEEKVYSVDIVLEDDGDDDYEEEFVTSYEPQIISANIMDAMVTNVDRSDAPNIMVIGDDDDDVSISATTEVVSDSEFDTLKTAQGGDNEEDGVQAPEENFVVVLILRSLDIVVLVVEKVILSGIPSLVSLGSTVSTRVDEVSRGGLGRIGWIRLEHSQGGSKRY